VTITSPQWNSLLYLKRSNFRFPDALVWETVQYLDQLTAIVGSRPEILSDYRPGDPRQHGQGRATDTTWPGQEPERVLNAIRAQKVWSGFGIYINDQGAVSFHTDTRTERHPENPATWGGLISHPFDAATGQNKKVIEYTTLARVLDVVKKKGAGIALSLIVLLFGIYLLTKRN
jgi:hypothetical protein